LPLSACGKPRSPRVRRSARRHRSLMEGSVRTLFEAIAVRVLVLDRGRPVQSPASLSYVALGLPASPQV